MFADFYWLVVTDLSSIWYNLVFGHMDVSAIKIVFI